MRAYRCETPRSRSVPRGLSAGRVARTVDEAVAAAEELGTPVMMKSCLHPCLSG
jgi:hypothetical protein